MPSCHLIALRLLMLLSLTLGAAQAATVVWSGTTSGTWSVGTNWVGNAAPSADDILQFPDAGLNKGTCTNDTGLRYASISFTGTGGGYTISGPVTLTAGISSSANSPNTNTYSGNVTISGAQSFTSSTAGATLVISGSVINDTNTLTCTGSGNITLSGVMGNSSGGLLKSGSGTLTLSNGETYTGTTTLNVGTLALATGADNRLPTGTTLAFNAAASNTSPTNIVTMNGNSQTLSAITFPDLASTTATFTGTGTTALTINGAADLNVGTGGSPGGVIANVLNLSSLSSFTFNSSSKSFNVGLKSGSTNTTASTSLVTLAASNSITAANLYVGFNVGSSSGGTSTLKLGAANTVNASLINIGANGRSNAVLQFNAAGSTATFRHATGGSTRVSNWLVGKMNNFAAVTWTDTVDLTNGTIDALVANLNIGDVNLGGNTGRTGTLTASFSMAGGTLDVTTLNLAIMQGSGVGSNTNLTGSGTFTLNSASGTLNIQSAMYMCTDTLTNTPADTRTLTSTFNLTNGTVNALLISRGTQTGSATHNQTFNWTTGTIGNISGSNLTFTNVPITLLSGTHTFSISGSNTATLDAGSPIGGATFSVTKSNTGTLTTNAANTYTGTTSVTGGTLSLGSGGSLANTAITVSNTATFAARPGSGSVNVGSTGVAAAGASLTLNSGSTFDMIDGAVCTCNLQQNATFATAGLVISGATLNFELSSSGSDVLAVTKGATVSSTNTIAITTVGSSLTVGNSYNIITAASGLTGGTWQFPNGYTTMAVVAGSNHYSLTLSSTNTAVTVTVGNPLVDVWNGTNSTDWNDATNWSLGAVPLVYHDVQIGNGSGTNKLAPSVTASGGICGSLTFTTLAATVGAGSGTLTIASGITANVTGSSIACPVTVSASQTWDTGANTLTVGGAISGAYALTKASSGTLILTGVNTSYTGAITISAGTLQIGDGTADGFIANSSGVTDNGTLTYNLVGSRTYGNIISGTGTLTKTGAGTLTLTGANTFSGTVTISQGILKVQSVAMSTSPRTYSISSGAVMNIDGNTVTATGTTTISGTGTLRITGGTFINGTGSGRNVTMSMGAGGLIDVQSGANFTNGGWSAFTWTSNLASMNVDGTFDVWDGNAVTIDALTGSGSVTKGWNGGAGSLVVGANGGSGTFSGIIDNALAISLTKTGSGTQTLSNANTYTGATAVNQGTLSVTGSITSNTTVASGAFLTGTGTISGTVTISNGGTVAPGVSGISTLTTGTLTLNPSSIYSVDLNASGPTSDRLAATGQTAALDGTLTIASASNAAANTTYTIVTAGTLTGTFSGLTDGTIFTQGGRKYRINYTGTTATLYDVTAPVLLTRQTLDTDGNGQIDRIRLTFDQALNDDVSGLTVTVGGVAYATAGTFATGTANDAVIDVLLTESGTPDTGTTPTVQITANTTLAANVTGTLIATEGSSTNATDTAAPVLLSATWTDGGTIGLVDAGDTITLTFSETVAAASMVAADLGLPVTNDTLDTTTIANQSGATTVSFTLAGTPRLSPGGTYLSSATGDGKPSGIYLASSTHLHDLATSPIAGLVGNSASAVDLTATPATSINIQWNDTHDTVAKTWTLNSSLLASTYTSSTYTILNIGYSSTALAITCSDSTSATTHWTVQPAVGANQFTMKADASSPLDGVYELVLGTSGITLAPFVRSGNTQAFKLQLSTPSTSSTAAQQNITITITASQY